MLTAARITQLANQNAKVRGFSTQAGDTLNTILGDLCQEQDLALARQVFTFNFDPGLTTLFGSGPYKLPLDYLRTSGTSGSEGVTRAAWYLYPAPAFPAGQAMPLVPIDLGEFDMYPQLPSQGLPSTIATDMGGPITSRIVLSTNAGLTAGSTTAVVALATAVGLVDGISVAGEGITPGAIATTAPLQISTTGTTAGTTTITGVPASDWDELRIGDRVLGGNVDTTIAALPVSGTITLLVAASGSITDEPLAIIRSMVMDKPATATNPIASVFFGIPPVCYIYPSPVGPYPCTIRYQRMMPSIVNSAQIPWFPNEGYLIAELSARMCELAGDNRTVEFYARAAMRLSKYLGLSDDKTNRAQTVQLDARHYGTGGNYWHLKNTKDRGW